MENNFRQSLRLVRLVRGNAHAVYLRLIGRHLWGWRRRLFRRLVGRQRFRRFKPLNLYGWSKHMFDLAVVERVARKNRLPPQWAGLKFFNVFGPNEYHKGEMMSLVAKRFDAAKAGTPIRPVQIASRGRRRRRAKTRFHLRRRRGCRRRWLLDAPAVSGIFNVGTGQARSFRDLVTADVRGARPRTRKSNISTRRLRSATTINISRRPRPSICAAPDLTADFTSARGGVKRYVSGYLDRADRHR